MLNCSQSIYTCSQCAYTTIRKYNFDRHMNMVHKIRFLDFEETHTQDEETHTQDEETHAHDEEMQMIKNNSLEPYQKIDNNYYRCNGCLKIYSCLRNIKQHLDKCKKEKMQIQCEDCLKYFASNSSLSHHKKICKGYPLVCIPQDEPKKENGTTIHNQTNIQSQTAETINNVGTQNNTINILSFPQEGDKNFDFICDKISNAVMKNLLQSSNTSSIGFNRFIKTVMDNPQNRLLHKTNPNTIYSKIHVGDNNWDYAHDDDVYPLLTHHMTTAALQKAKELKEDIQIVKEIYNKLEPFIKHVREINEMDYESDEYKSILLRIKLIIVNLTRKWMDEQK